MIRSKKYKQMLIENTNIEMAKDEMAVIDNILFRFWQMNWLDKLEQFPSAQPEKRTEERTETHSCDLISRQEAIECDGFREVERDDERRSN